MLKFYNFVKKKIWHIFYDNYCNWNYLSCEEFLSEFFIREFSDKVQWYWISYTQILSEKFILEFSDKVDWKMVSLSQKLSKNFIAKNLDKLYIPYLIKNDEISNETKEYIKMLI